MNSKHLYSTGTEHGYLWIVAEQMIDALHELVLQFHAGMRLGIVAFDGGPITPSLEEQAGGWRCDGRVMVSPALAAGLEIPCDQYDEWVIVQEGTQFADEYETFVSYGGFTVESPDDIYRRFDPTWERAGLDFLVPIQERFWQQIERLQPVSYFCLGDREVVVSRNGEFIRALEHSITT